MKKLALALVCLVSAAIFASCDPTNVVENPEPSIYPKLAEGYLVDGQVIDLNVEYPYGFSAVSNLATQKELSRLVITCAGETICDSAISGTSFDFEGVLELVPVKGEIVDTLELAATVKDVDGETASAILTLYLNEEDNLVPTEFTWNRHGAGAGTGLDVYGLQWTKNEREIYAVITPMEGATLYRFNAERDIWNSVQTAADKVALFSENVEPINEFKEVSCTAAEKEYDIVIGTIYNGEYNLIHVTKSAAFTFKGTDVTITGESK